MANTEAAPSSQEDQSKAARTLKSSQLTPEETEQNPQQEEATTVDDLDQAINIEILRARYPGHSYQTCKRALKVSQLRLDDAIELLSCKTFVPTTDTDTAPGQDQEPSPEDKPVAIEPFPFLKLPQEVRLMVYKEYLILPGTISIVGSGWAGARSIIKLRRECALHAPSHQSHVAMDRSVLSLWSTSRTLYKESMSLFFRHNDFRFANLTQLHRFLTRISVNARRAIASIWVGYFGTTPAKTFKLLKECVGLRRLTIELQQSSIGTIPWVAKSMGYQLMKIYGLADLLKIRGLQEVEVELGQPTLIPLLRNFDEELVLFKEALQVLKQPHTAAQLTRQEKKDYPHGVGRTIFGKANVTTRMEKKVMGIE
ncbi:hypothetical protein P7C71_g1335, partial [Lecanoromycetidae sp. Uapishka_2]